MKPVKIGNLILAGAGKLSGFLNQTEAARTEWIAKKIRVSAWPKESFAVPIWQAHRGYWVGGAPQNSLASIHAAREQGARMVEFDVRVTRDRIPILFHDEEIVSSTGEKLAVNSLTLRELKQHISVTKLQEVFESDRATEFFNIEIKSEKVLDEPIERYVANVVEQFGVQNRILFSSFNPISLWKMAQYLPKVPRALLVAPDMKERSLREMWWSLVVPIHALHVDHMMLTQERMADWKARGVPVAAWTVNDSRRMEELLSWGVFSIITDKIPPTKLRQ